MTFMQISIITVAYNSAAVIRETIESVLLQEYERIEYLIIDGASTDDTVKIAEEYRDRMEGKGIRYRIYSDKDNGIYDAMNKGILLATGDIIGILNTGDWYEKNTLQTAADIFKTKECDLLFGDIRIIKQNGSAFIKKARLRKYQSSRDWNHPTMFVKAELYKENLFPCRGLHDDYGFYLKMVKKNMQIVTVNHVMANFHMGGVSNRKGIKASLDRIKDRYQWCYRINGYSRGYLLECIAIEGVKMLLG